MAKSFRIHRPPTTDDQDLNRWMERVADALNAVPPFSVISTADGPESSQETAEPGTIAIDIGSSATTVWVKSQTVSQTTGWASFNLSI